MKKKIGTSKVKNGVARDFFSISEDLPKGVYELIGEYKGSNVYKPSYDIKKLIVGNYAGFEGLKDFYKVTATDREIRVSGTLYGYDDNNTKRLLAGHQVYLRIGRFERNPTKSDYERVLDATVLSPPQNLGIGKKFVLTDENGKFTFTTSIPMNYTDYHYELFLYFMGTDDYVANVKRIDLYNGNMPTVCKMGIYPSYNIKNDGVIVLRASVVEAEDVDANGNILNNATYITDGRITFWISENGIDNWKRITFPDGSQIPDEYLLDTKIVQTKYTFTEDKDVSKTFYFKAKYYGSKDAMGYADSESKIWSVLVDANGTTAKLIKSTISSFSAVSDNTIWCQYGEDSTGWYSLKTIVDNQPVPTGQLRMRLRGD